MVSLRSRESKRRTCFACGGLGLGALIILAGASNPPSPGVPSVNQPPQPTSGSHQAKPQPSQQTTGNDPLGAKAIPSKQSSPETTNPTTNNGDASSPDWWMVALTAGLLFIGALQAFVFWIQAGRLKQTIDKMDQIAVGQTNDMAASIAQWSRVADALDDVAKAMALNAEQLQETIGVNHENLATSKRIADQQEKIGALQTRAYLAVAYITVVPQNNNTLYRFEPRMQLTSSGSTPAYKVSSRAVSAVLSHPLPDDFPFPIPDATPIDGLGMLGPRNGFILSAPAPQMYSDLEIAEIKNGSRSRLYVWGIVDYEDAFGNPRYVKFSQSIVWMQDLVNTLAFNTRHHNDAN